MLCPAQSPDINPTEHLWVHLKKVLNQYPKPPKGVYELWERARGCHMLNSSYRAG